MSLHCEERTYAQSCHTAIEDADHLNKIQDAVSRMHQIKMLAGELLARHIHRCLDSKGEMPLPEFTQTWCRQLFKEVSCLDADKKGIVQKTDDIALTNTCQQMNEEVAISRPSRSGLTQMLSQEAILLCASIKTNIATHYKKRLHQYVRWTFHTKENVMPTEAYKSHKLHMLQVVVDLCRPENSEMVLPVQFHGWIALYRMLFGLDAMLKQDGIEKALAKTPHLFLPSMRLMNRAFEGSGKHTFSMLPLTRKFRPGFVSFDRKICAEVLKIPECEADRERKKERAKEKQKEKASGTWMHPTEKHAQKKREREHAEEEQKKARKVQIANETSEEKKKRVVAEKKEAEERKRQKREEVQLQKDKSRDSIELFFANFLNIKVKIGDGFRFNYSFKTDGVSIRFLFTKMVMPRQRDAKHYANTKPKRGMFTPDELRKYKKLHDSNMQVVGIDPGKHDLVHAACDDYLIDPCQHLRYTASQRRADKCSMLYANKMQAEKPLAVSDAEKKLGKHNSRSSCPDKLNAYFEERRLNFGIFYQFYGQIIYRARRWRTFKKDQQSISSLINNFKGMRKKGKTLALAYGSWAKCSTKLPMKGIAPCIGIGLRRRLAKEFVVVDVPEHYTSQTCSKCFWKCGPFHELETVRRAEKKAKCTTQEEEKKASRLQIRSIRRCQNAECGVVLNRDRNAAC